MVKILFKLRDGVDHSVEIEAGYSVMEAAYNNMLPGIEAMLPGIEAECGGGAACATCHVYIAPEWEAKLPPIADIEDAMLLSANDRRSNSRLSCQIHVTEDMDGLSVEVADNDI